MQIEYSEHIKNRLDLRRIEHGLPKRIFEQAEERYFDREGGGVIDFEGNGLVHVGPSFVLVSCLRFE